MYGSDTVYDALFMLLSLEWFEFNIPPGFSWLDSSFLFNSNIHVWTVPQFIYPFA